MIKKYCTNTWESNLNIESLKSEPGDIIIIDPYVLNRSVVQNSNFFRMSIDLRYADLNSIEKLKFKGFKIKLIKFLNNKKIFIKKLLNRE